MEVILCISVHLSVWQLGTNAGTKNGRLDFAVLSVNAKFRYFVTSQHNFIALTLLSSSNMVSRFCPLCTNFLICTRYKLTPSLSLHFAALRHIFL